VKILKNVKEVAEWRLCLGCGACAYACREGKVKLFNVIHDGIRPRIDGPGCSGCGECLQVCPGYETSHGINRQLSGDKILYRDGYLSEYLSRWGPILEVWEGYAADSDLRSCGSSGGLVSAIAAYCIEKGGMFGALHIGADEESPWLNRTVFSHTRADLLKRTGSRYSPASPCDSLQEIDSAPSVCVFIGKPCDVVGLRKAQVLRPGLDRNIGLAIGFFCAGTPSTAGLLDLINRNKINMGRIEEVRYRGIGWPGKFVIRLKGERNPTCEIPYLDSWGFLQRYRPYRCYLCPDGTGEFADIACGDPWYREISEGEKGYSLVLVRTEKGRRILEGVRRMGYAVMEQAHPEILLRSQKNLLAKRSSIWGRTLVMKALRIPTPRLLGFSLFDNWKCLPMKEKFRSTMGTLLRIIKRRYYRPISLSFS